MVRNHGANHDPTHGTDPTRPIWRAYTPVLTASTTDPTLGSGATRKGRWIRLGNLIIYTFYIQFGTSGTNAGSGTYRVSLPTPYHLGLYTSTQWALGSIKLNESGAGGFTAVAQPRSTTENTDVTMFTSGSAGAAVTASVPWAWAASDAISGTLTYMAARG
jgi:hypothetical protein